MTWRETEAIVKERDIAVAPGAHWAPPVDVEPSAPVRRRRIARLAGLAGSSARRESA